MFVKSSYGKLRNVTQKIAYKQALLSIVFAAILIALAVFTWPDKNLHVYFFDVGQGDSIFIRTPANYKILVDGGPDQTVLERLSSVLPFYDRKLDLIILTHPHADHVNGLNDVLERYQV